MNLFDWDNNTDVPDIFIKSAEPEDVDIIHEIELESHQAPWNRESFEKIIKRQEKYIHLIVICDDKNKKIMGYICFQFLFDELYLLNVTIKQNHRRRGVAEKILKFLINRACKLGCSRVVLDVNPGNIPAVKLYEKLGFNFSMSSKNINSVVMFMEFSGDKQNFN
jgi:ribosomal-protein-alanine N-acetyltransferase